MKKIFILALVGFILMSANPVFGAADEVPYGQESSMSSITDRSFLNIHYGKKRAELKDVDDPTQDRLLDIYLPQSERPAKGYPVLVFIHGGGFTGGSKELNRNIEMIFDGVLRKGYAVVTINYYLMLKGKKMSPTDLEEQEQARQTGRFGAKYDMAIDEASKDAVMALRWVYKHAKEYGLDRSFIAISGGSAGAMTALHTTFVKSPKKPRIRAVVNCWGGMSDVSRIKDATIPTFTIHGDKDDLVNVQFGRRLQKRLEEIGSSSSKIHILEGRGHAQYQYVGEHMMGEITDFLDAVRTSISR